MWQKLKRLDVINLEKARLQIINVLQLVSAAPRSFSPSNSNEYLDWPVWQQNSSAFVSNKFGKNNEIDVSLDIERFILSINGQAEQREHLVLSGMTYPMAYGWMSIKLGAFHLDIGKFSDAADYKLERYLKPDEEINTEDQSTYDQIVIHYANANFLFNKLAKQLGIKGKVLVHPATANMLFIPANGKLPSFGFSLGNKSFPEPYFYFKIDPLNIKTDHVHLGFGGIWNSTDSNYVIMESDFLNQNQDLEFHKVMTFFVDNYQKITKT